MEASECRLSLLARHKSHTVSAMATNNLSRIQKAIEFILANAKKQPNLKDISAHLAISPHYLHRLFVQHAGITPQQFLHATNVENAKQRLLENKDLLSTALDVGLSGTGRLHDQFVSIEAVSPGEFRTKGEGIEFHWGTSTSPFGYCFIAWTNRGIHRLEFIDDNIQSLFSTLQSDWPKATFVESQKDASSRIKNIFQPKNPTQLWVKGTNFQINVWKALLNIPKGDLATYSAIAHAIMDKKAQRAVGSAIGKNPIAILIPCHRVIRSSGLLNHYRWEAWRKALILGSEVMKNEEDKDGIK